LAVTARHIVQIQIILLLTALLVACSGIEWLRVARFEPADDTQTSYKWSVRDRALTLVTPDYQLTLGRCNYYWVGSASFGGNLHMRFNLENYAPESGEVELVSATLIPIRVKKSQGLDLTKEYPIQLEEVFREEYNQFRKDSRGDGRASWERMFVPDNLAIGAREGELSVRIPFRPRRIEVKLVIKNTSTQETETLTFIVRERGLRGRL